MMPYEKLRFVAMTSTVQALKGMQNCFEAVFLETPLLALVTAVDLASPTKRCNKCNMLQVSLLKTCSMVASDPCDLGHKGASCSQ
jgi:hypothetical protein